MRESYRFTGSRTLVLILVSIGHLAVLAALLLPARSPSAPAPAPVPLSLMNLQPPVMPRIRSEDAVHRRRAADSIRSLGLPDIESPRLALAVQAAPTPSAHGNGVGVDWAAEARRALQAYEIRSHQQVPSAVSVAGEPGNDYWLRQIHHAGEQMKTTDGDWIIWTDANCFQIARADPITASPVATSPEITCVPTIEDQRGAATLRR